ncbi:branched-chain amino acid ABC transporter substrate-binding protein [Thermomonospora curvata]|nr:branched-chain amino acid ABC transporter substrate-binding protein [Thermomonospora curvata]
MMRVTGAMALSAVLALSAAACGGDDGGSGGDGNSVTIGFLGDLTGENSGIVIPPKQGAQLAIDEYNATNPKVKIVLKTYDSQGQPDQATSLVQSAIKSDNIVGLIGPAFSGESQQAVPVLEEGKIPNISASATNVTLGEKGWKYWHRVVGNDSMQGTGVAEFLVREAKAKKVFVAHDNEDYSKGLADYVTKGLKEKGVTVEQDVVDPRASDYSSTVNKAKAFKPDAIFYGGYYAQGGRLLKQLRENGVDALFASGDGSLDKGLIEGAGEKNAVNTVVSCPCLIDPTGESSPASKKFAEAYKAKYNSEPAIYAAEGYDAATAFIEAIKAGNTTTEAINEFLKTIDVPGVSKQIKFDDKGEPAGGDVYIYRVEGKELPLLGKASEAKLQ